MKKARILILTTIAAPYRVKLFNELGKDYDLTVCFEQRYDYTRNNEWYSNEFINFNAVFLQGSDRGKNLIHIDFHKFYADKSYSCIIFYEYSTLTATCFILKAIIDRRKYILNCDGSLLEQRNNMYEFIKKILIKNAIGYISGGEYGKKYFQNHGADENKISIINFTSLYHDDVLSHTVSKNEKEKLRKKYGVSGDKIAISVGRFIRLKNIELLIKTWSKIDERHTLLLIGDGESKQSYRSLINELALNNVILIDFQEKKTLFDFYKLSDLFIHPTLSDVWGLVINEAMSCGLPVITTNNCVAGLELIKDGVNGYLVDATDQTGLYRSISKVINDNELREKMSYENMVSIGNFTYEKSGELLSQALDSIFRNGGIYGKY